MMNKEVLCHGSPTQYLRQLIPDTGQNNCVYLTRLFVARVKHRKLQTLFAGNCKINGWGKCRFTFAPFVDIQGIGGAPNKYFAVTCIHKLLQQPTFCFCKKHHVFNTSFGSSLKDIKGIYQFVDMDYYLLTFLSQISDFLVEIEIHLPFSLSMLYPGGISYGSVPFL